MATECTRELHGSRNSIVNSATTLKPKPRTIVDQELEATWKALVNWFADGNHWLVIGTVALAVFAYLQVEISRRTARRQLRGYVSLRPTIIYNIGYGYHPRIDFIAKNHGQTPCSDLRAVYEIALLPEPLPPAHKFPTPESSLNFQNSLFPGADLTIWIVSKRALTPDEVNDIFIDRQRLHCWGILYYRDAFRRERQTKFSASVGGQAFSLSVFSKLLGVTGPEWQWTFGVGHNDAT